MTVAVNISFALVAFIVFVEVFDVVSIKTFIMTIAVAMITTDAIQRQRRPRTDLVLEIPHQPPFGPVRTAECGVDLNIPDAITVPAGVRGFMIDTQIRAVPTYDTGTLVLLRSSAAKKGLRLANSVGVIDPGYRGTLRICVDNVLPDDIVLAAGTAVAQICMPHFRPFVVRTCTTLHPSLLQTARGEGGFGSTGAAGSTQTLMRR
jgi:dUTP pyrophosphatase